MNKKKLISVCALIIIFLLLTTQLPAVNSLPSCKNIHSNIEKKIVYKEYYPGALTNDPYVCFYAADEVIVKFYGPINVSEIEEVNGSQVIDRDQGMFSVLVKVTIMDIDTYIAIVRDREDVEYAGYNYIAEGNSGSPSDPDWDKQWGHKATYVHNAWEHSTGYGVPVAVLDTGLFFDHEDIEEWRCFAQTDFVNNDDDATDDYGHGTHNTAIIMSAHNDKGIAGIAPRSLIVPIKVLDEDCYGTEYRVVKGIFHASDYAKVISISISFFADSMPYIEKACDLAFEKGSLIVASIGNYGESMKYEGYPAKLSNVIGVGAVEWIGDKFGGEKNFPDPNELIAWEYNTGGAKPDLMAPGVNIWSALINHPSSYGYVDGTSPAAAYVAGIAALYFEKNPKATPQQCINKLYETAIRCGPRNRNKEYMPLGNEKNDNYGYGLVNAYGVVKPKSVNRELGEEKLSIKYLKNFFQNNILIKNFLLHFSNLLYLNQEI